MLDNIKTLLQSICGCFFTPFQREKKNTSPRPLVIEGCSTTLTPEADKAETAAQAVLDILSNDYSKSRNPGESRKPEMGTEEYYSQLLHRIRDGWEMEARQATRYVAYCEQQLKNTLLPVGQLADLERELYRRLDIIEREGGELKKRWQHCLAEVTVRQMNTRSTEDTKKKE